MRAPGARVRSKPVRPAGVAQSEARLLASGALLQQVAQGAGLLALLAIVTILARRLSVSELGAYGLVASLVGAWLLTIGALAALHQFGGLVTAVASQPWGVLIAAVLFALAGSVYQIAVQPSPEVQERLRSEKERLKLRKAEQKALEKRWGAK